MNKKGFTLIELLAVIAILAILAIISLPNLINLFNEAKEKSFTTEVKELFKNAENKWMNNSILESREMVYARTKQGNCENSLDLSGRSELNYYLKLNNAGKVIEYYAEDGTYQYSYNGPGLNIEDIEYVVSKATIDENDQMEITCTGAIRGELTSGCRLVSGSVSRTGSEIVCGTEHFYVIRIENGKVRMLAAKNITLSLSNPIQTDTFTPTYFSTTPYWYDENNNEVIAPYKYRTSTDNNNTTVYYVYDSNSNIYQYIEKYVDVLKNIGLSDVSAELLRMEDINVVPTVRRREGIKYQLSLLSQEDYNSYKEWAINTFGTQGIQTIIAKYNLQNIWDFNTLTEDDKAVGIAALYSLLDENGLLEASDAEQKAAVAEIIDEFNAYLDWLPEWMYTHMRDYYSGETSFSTNLIYPWKSSWDGGGAYNWDDYLSIRPVVIVPTSEIK